MLTNKWYENAISPGDTLYIAHDYHDGYYDIVWWVALGANLYIHRKLDDLQRRPPHTPTEHDLCNAVRGLWEGKVYRSE